MRLTITIQYHRRRAVRDESVPLKDLDPRLVEILRDAGREWGPLGVARAAATVQRAAAELAAVR